MDPDSEVEKSTSKIVAPFLIALLFTACESYKEQNEVFPAEKEQHSGSLKENKTDSNLLKAKTIYFTFDDGPNKGTGMVLKVAAEEKIPISMFFIGTQLHGSLAQMRLFKQVKQNPLVEIVNHSYTHAHNHFDNFYRNPGEVIADFSRAEDSLGLHEKIVRTPGRNIWRTAQISSTDLKKCEPSADSLYKAGYTAVGWDVEWTFNNRLKLTKTTQQMLDKVDSFFSKNETKTPGHLVLLAHDQSFADSTDAASLKNFIEQLKNSGRYQFEMISKYPGLK